LGVSRPSITAPVFKTNLEDLLDRLEGDDSLRALELRREVWALRDVFRTWQEERPGDVARLAVIHRLFEVFHKTMDYLTAK
jgi:hypothetical protein